MKLKDMENHMKPTLISINPFIRFTESVDNKEIKRLFNSDVFRNMV